MVELIGKRYGQALFELAIESGDLKTREQEIQLMVDAFSSEEEFLDILNLPKLSGKDKIEMLKTVFEGNVHDDFIGFLVLAVEKNRQEYIVDILNYTLTKIEEYNGFVTAHIESAIPLKENEKKLIVSRLEAQTGKKITLKATVDNSLIGGLIIRINDRIVDNSIRRNLHRMAIDVYEAKV